jgi:Mg/Co/Ni transporter MgtE
MWNKTGSRRLRIAVGAGIAVFAVIGLSSLASGTLPAVLEIVGAIPPAIIVGFLVYVLLPVLKKRR